MKRRWIITLLLLPVVVLAVLFLTRNLHTVPPDECSDVYRQYKDTPGIKASFIKDYPLDDTTTIDVTSFTALDTASWRWLREQFGCSGSIFESEEPGYVASRRAPKNHYDQPTNLKNQIENDEIYCSGAEKTIEVFHITNLSQFEAFKEITFNKINCNNLNIKK